MSIQDKWSTQMKWHQNTQMTTVGAGTATGQQRRVMQLDIFGLEHI